ADEGVARPGGELVTGVEHQAGGRDYRVPPHLGCLELAVRGVVGDVLAVVVDAFGHHWIPVVGALLDEVQLVTAARGHLDVPQAALRVEGDAQRVAVTQRPDLGSFATLAGEGVAGGRRAVVIQTHDLAQRGVDLLRRILLVALTGGGVHQALAVEGDAVAEVQALIDFRVGAPDDVEVLDRRTGEIQRAAGNHGTTRFIGAGFHVADVDGVVTREIRVQHDVAEAALEEVVDGWRAGNLG